MAKPDLTRWTFLALALVCLLTLGAPSGAIPVTSVIGITPVTAAGPSSGCWSASTGAPLASPEVTLDGIAALSSADVWAVGSHTPPNSRSLTLIEHWDGRGWSIAASPSPGAFLNTLTAVAAVSANDVWAVGAYGQAGTDSKTLILHWDGRAWSQVASPSVGRTNQLTAISAISANDVWAVGSYSSGPGEQALALHWDGTSWTQVATPDVPGPNNAVYDSLQAVAGSTSDNVWAVGRGDVNGPLVIRWDGHNWTRAQLPRLDASPNLLAVAVLGPDNVWATGGTFEHGAFAMHWDGRSWDTPPTPYPGDYPSSLNSLAAIAPNDIWAVGRVGSSRMLVEHWDGSAWSIVSGTPDARGALTGSIAATPATPGAPQGDLWIAGSAIDRRTELRQGLLVHHTATPCASSMPIMPLPPPVPLPGSGSHTFPETGKAVSGLFLDYWNSHGGLMQQGYPISGVLGEVSDLNGKLYTVQYFERAVFEYHPENRAPFNVLLSQLGTFEYGQKYPNGALDQKPNNSPGSVLFNETGRRLGGRFLQYWRDHGGLMQQGYPISNEFTQVSPLNGRPYTVQYFERAVFEYHPENKPPFDVLLSHLGRFRYDRKYSAPPAQTPTPTPTATQAPILLSDSVPYPYNDKPVGGGRYIFWTDTHTSPWAIVGYDVDAGRVFTVTRRPLLKGIIATDGKTLAWIERPPSGAPERIRGFDIATGREFPIIESATERNFMALAVDGSTLYYEELTSGHAGLYAHNISSGSEELISNRPSEVEKRPVAAGGVLLWEEVEQRCSGGGPCTLDVTLHMLKRDGASREKVIATAIQLSGYDVSGDNVVWGGFPEAPITIYSISTASARSLSALAGTDPHILGNTVAWTGAPSTAPGGESGWSVKAQDLTTGVVSTLVPDSPAGKQVQAIAGQNRKAVAYTVENGANWSSSLYLIYVK